MRYAGHVGPGFSQATLADLIGQLRPLRRPTNPFAKGLGSRAAGVAMAFKLIESAQARWRTVNAPHLVALVRAGAKFERGQLVERPDGSGGDQQVA